MTIGRPIRLVAHGGPGLSCSESVVALGEVSLVRVTQGGSRRADVRPLNELAEILRLAYGPLSPESVQRCHRGLSRTAAQLERGDLARASLEALMISLPALAPPTLAKLAEFADIEKAGTAWQDQPRIPVGQTGGGQWTADGGGAATPGHANVDATRPSDG